MNRDELHPLGPVRRVGHGDHQPRPANPTGDRPMTARKRTGIRSVEEVEGGIIAWLYPGGADLDAVLLELVQEYEVDHDDAAGVVISYHRGEGPDPLMPPHREEGEPHDREAWDTYWSHLPPRVGVIDEENPTTLPAEPIAGHFRRFPWCTCGEGHDWHYEESSPGPGAMLAVLVSWYA